MLQRIRNASETNFFNASLGDTVEVDGLYIGGKKGNRYMKDRIKGKKDKAIILVWLKEKINKLRLLK